MLHKDSKKGGRWSSTKYFLIIGIVFLFAGCSLNNSSVSFGITKEQSSPSANILSTATSAFSPTVTLATPDLQSQLMQETLWISPAVPAKLSLETQKSGVPMATSSVQATIQLRVNKDPGSSEEQKSTWIYAFAAPFPALIDGISITDLKQAWQGEVTGLLKGASIWMDETTLVAFSTIWGEPGIASHIKTTSYEQLLDSVWGNQPSYAIIPFEDIEAQWKILTIDGQSPIHKEFDPTTYPLKITFSLSGDRSYLMEPSLFESNRDPGKMTVLVMTGVTALVRATADKMEVKGRLYPGEAIRDWLVKADITHISNEIPFSTECPYPDRNSPYLFFCSDPRNIQLLDYVGTDIVELTGNHFQDWGSEATIYTIGLYNERGWLYFGGGINAMDARKSIKIEHNGNKIAFIGCNPSGPDYAWATDTEPGAARCDMSWMTSELTRLRAEGYNPIATFQYFEGYSVWPGPSQTADFRMMADAGAVIVSGSQAHLPMTMEFYNGSYIHYGLGNLFFDQMDYPGVGTATRREFLDRHIFYDGKYINTELLTAMLEDYSQPRPMTDSERNLFLSDIFIASGW
jgi:hypothetical protein